MVIGGGLICYGPDIADQFRQAAGYVVGGSDTTYAVVAVGDYFGNGTDDILFRNNATGDTWIEAISNGASDGWHQLGGSNTSYTVKT